MKFVGILNGKIFDICSDLVNKRTRDDGIELSKEGLEKIVYLETNEKDLMVGDTWVNNESLKDSPQRFIEPEKPELELLNERVEVLEEELKIIKEYLKLGSKQ